jgi:hypothetical protein
MFFYSLDLYNTAHFNLIIRQVLTLEQTGLDLVLEEQARSQTINSLIIMGNHLVCMM